MRKTGDVRLKRLAAMYSVFSRNGEKYKGICFYKVKELDEKKFIKTLNLLFFKFNAIIDMERSFIEFLHDTINLNLNRG